MSKFLISFFFGMLMSLFGTTIFAQDICPIDVSSLPRCAAGSGLISEHLPQQIVFLPPKLSTNELSEILDAVEGTTVKISKSSFYRLKQNGQGNPDFLSLIEKLERNHSAEEPSELSPTGTYKRDAVTFQFNSQENKITLFQTKRLEKDRPLPQKFCGIRVELAKVPAGEEWASYGGNLMIFPGGLCVHGSKMPAETAKKYCGNAPTVSLDTSYTAMDHVDEIVTVIPDKRRAPPCDFSVIRSSSEKFIKTLGSNFDQPFFKDLDSVLEAEKNNSCSKTGRCYMASRFCDLYSDYKYLEKMQRSLSPEQVVPTKSQSTRSVAGSVEIDPAKLSPEDRESYFAKKAAKESEKKALLMQKLNDEEKYADIYKLDSEFEKPDCKKMTNRDVALMMGANFHFRSLRTYIDQKNSETRPNFDGSIMKRLQQKLESIEYFQTTNEDFDKIQQANIDLILKHLPKECAKSDLVIDLPTLIDGSSLSPNPANLTAFGKGIFYPRQFNDQIEDSVKRSLEVSGMKASSINTTFFHTGNGNVHCLTNGFRLCKP